MVVWIECSFYHIVTVFFSKFKSSLEDYIGLQRQTKKTIEREATFVKMTHSFISKCGSWRWSDCSLTNGCSQIACSSNDWWFRMTGKSWSHLLSLATLCGCCCVHCCLTYWCFDNGSILQLLYYSIITWMEDTGNIHYSKGQKQPFHSLHRRNMFNKFNTWPIYYIILYGITYILCMQIFFHHPPWS